MERELVQFKEKILSEIQTLNNQPTLSPSELCNGKEAVEVLNAIQKYNLMSGGNYDNEYEEDSESSFRRGRNPNTGRYMSMNRHMNTNMGRSGHSIKDRAKANLEKMYDETSSPHEQQEIDRIMQMIDNA